MMMLSVRDGMCSGCCGILAKDRINYLAKLVRVVVFRCETEKDVLGLLLEC